MGGGGGSQQPLDQMRAYTTLYFSSVAIGPFVRPHNSKAQWKVQRPEKSVAGVCPILTITCTGQKFGFPPLSLYNCRQIKEILYFVRNSFKELKLVRGRIFFSGAKFFCRTGCKVLQRVGFTVLPFPSIFVSPLVSHPLAPRWVDWF